MLKVIKKGEFWKQRFRYGFVPKQSADWAWVQHMLASAKEETGRVGVVIDNGCLFRGGKEQAEEINVEMEWQELRIMEEEIAGVEAKIEGYLKEIKVK